MKCSNCGAELGANDVFCQNCGASVENSNVQGNAQGVGANTNQFSNYGPLNNQPNYGMQGNMQQNNVNQPNNMQQPNYGFTPAPKKNNTMTYVAVISILIAIVLAIVVVVKVVVPSSNSGEKDKDIGGTTIETPKDEENTYKVKFGGFKFSIPESVESDTSERDYLYIGNEEDDWIAAITIMEGSFSSLKDNKSRMKTSLYQYISQSSYDYEFEITDPQIEKVGDVEFITMDVEVEGDRQTVVFAQLNSTYVAAIDLYVDDSVRKDVFEILSGIIDSAEYQGASSYIQEDSLDIEDVNKAFESLFKNEQTNQVNQTVE